MAGWLLSIIVVRLSQRLPVASEPTSIVVLQVPRSILRFVCSISSCRHSPTIAKVVARYLTFMFRDKQVKCRVSCGSMQYKTNVYYLNTSVDTDASFAWALSWLGLAACDRLMELFSIVYATLNL